MKPFLSKFSPSLPVMLIVSSAFSMALLIARLYFTFRPMYAFLCWNLFLAWIPLLISFRLSKKPGKKFTIVSVSLIFLWLLFFPNAPYLITDLIHLKQRPPVPLWFDLILLLSFAWNGLMMGIVSLHEIKKFLSGKLSVFATELTILFFILISSFGIYLGRFLRWNSWDVFFDSSDLAHDILNQVINVKANPQALFVTLLLAALQSIIYLTYSSIKNENKSAIN